MEGHRVRANRDAMYKVAKCKKTQDNWLQQTKVIFRSILGCLVQKTRRTQSTALTYFLNLSG